MADSPAIRIPADLHRQLVDHARAGAPLEACGIVAARSGLPERFYPATNAARSPVRYNIDPQDLLRITLDIEAQGTTLWAIFHSHPQTEAYPSQTDIRLAFYPEAIYLICSLADPAQPHLRGFRIEGLRVTEMAVSVES